MITLHSLYHLCPQIFGRVKVPLVLENMQGPAVRDQEDMAGAIFFENQDVANLPLHSKHPILKKRHRFMYFYVTETKRRGQTQQTLPYTTI